jgi:hypothetical protein
VGAQKKGAHMAITDKRQYIPGPGGMGDLPFSNAVIAGNTVYISPGTSVSIPPRASRRKILNKKRASCWTCCATRSRALAFRCGMWFR